MTPPSVDLKTLYSAPRYHEGDLLAWMRALRSGKSQSEVARQFGVNRKTVRRRLTELGVDPQTGKFRKSSKSKRLRQQEREAHEALRCAQDVLEASAEYRLVEAARERAKGLSESIGAVTQAVREEALEAYRASGDTRPEPAVSIRMYTRYVWDHDEVRDWLMLNAPTYLTVAARRFEKAAETLPGAPVTIEREPRPAIARDLSTYLDDTAAEARADGREGH